MDKGIKLLQQALSDTEKRIEPVLKPEPPEEHTGYSLECHIEYTKELIKWLKMSLNQK